MSMTNNNPGGIRRRASTRGAATVEATIALPVFVILFVGLYFIRDLQTAKHYVDSEARHCAWQYSMQGCAGELPASCGSSTERRDSDSRLTQIEGDFRDQVNKPWDANPADSVTTPEFSDDPFGIKKAVYKLIQDQVMAKLAEVLNKSHVAEKAIERDRPLLFGGGTTRISGSYRLACNVQGRTAGDLVSAAWSAILP